MQVIPLAQYEDKLLNALSSGGGPDAARFKDVVEALKDESRSAGDLLPVLFRRPLDAHQTFFAMGEAIAHLHYLYYAGRLKRANGADGIMRYAAS